MQNNARHNCHTKSFRNLNITWTLDLMSCNANVVTSIEWLHKLVKNFWVVSCDRIVRSEAFQPALELLRKTAHEVFVAEFLTLDKPFKKYHFLHFRNVSEMKLRKTKMSSFCFVVDLLKQQLVRLGISRGNIALYFPTVYVRAV